MLSIKKTIRKIGLIAFLGMSCSISALTQPNPETILQGNVSYVSTVMFESKYVSTTKTEMQAYSKEKMLFRKDFYYDTKIRVSLEVDFKTNNAEKSAYEYIYDVEGRITKKIETFAANRQLYQTTEFTYNQQGKLTKSVTFDAENKVFRLINYTYDDQERLVREATFNSIHFIIKDLRYTYDNKGNQVKIENKKTYASTNIPYRIEQTFDEKGNLTSKQHFDEKNVLTSLYQAKYSAQNRMVFEMESNADGDTLTKADYQYDKKGRLSIYTSYNFQNPSLRKVKMVFKYDSNDRLLSIITYFYDDPNPSITKTYYYDEQGNWKAWVENSSRINVVCERKIRYY